MTAFELYALSIAGLAIAVLVGWRINSRERRRNAELPVNPQEALICKAEMRGSIRMFPWFLYLLSFDVFPYPPGAWWIRAAQLTVACSLALALQWYYSRHPLVPPQPTPSSTTA